ncbi:MAG: exodeoxyribonuclease VII small subunit [Legionellales bacterium]|nr:exodeoxyribonuclease VII small subunit [Legionellales bacterium]|tara:strand:- start:2463 stop:2690 length:228 start_codon:yes stop_codon:yes gene_type:complete
MTEKKQPSFEKQLEALDDIVKKMEHGELTLSESIDAYEKGIGLVKQCQKALQTAKQKVSKLNDGQLEPFDDVQSD